MPPPETIAAVFSGFIGLIGAFAAFISRRDKRIAEDYTSLRREVRKLRSFVKELSSYAFGLEVEITRTGGTVPGTAPDYDRLFHDEEDEDRKRDRVR